jgi:hypothetical protein
VKDAKSEAQKEIEDYRSQKETEFKSFETEVSGQNAAAFAVCSAAIFKHETLRFNASEPEQQLTPHSTPAATRRPRKTRRRPPRSSLRISSRSARRRDPRYEPPQRFSKNIVVDLEQVVDDLLKAVITVNPEVPTRTEQPTV